MELTEGTTKLELSQADVAQAVQFWLNERILRMPCNVIGIVRSGAGWQPATFEVHLREQDTDK